MEREWLRSEPNEQYGGDTMRWYYWALIVIGLIVLVWIKAKFIWPRLFKQEKREYDD